MLRCVVFSDTHGNIDRAVDAILLLKEVDMIIHLGDTTADAREIAHVFPDIPVHSVAGNNDFCSSVPLLKSVKFGEFTLLLTHGHCQGVKTSKECFARLVKEQGADMGLFGHTHREFDGLVEGTRLVNPGSSKDGYSRMATCAVLEIDGGKLKSTIWQIP